MRGDKECPLSGVTKSGRVWRKVPESGARSVGKALSGWPHHTETRKGSVRLTTHRTETRKGSVRLTTPHRDTERLCPADHTTDTERLCPADHTTDTERLCPADHTTHRDTAAQTQTDWRQDRPSRAGVVVQNLHPEQTFTWLQLLATLHAPTASSLFTADTTGSWHANERQSRNPKTRTKWLSQTWKLLVYQIGKPRPAPPPPPPDLSSPPQSPPQVTAHSVK